MRRAVAFVGLVAFAGLYACSRSEQAPSQAAPASSASGAPIVAPAPTATASAALPEPLPSPPPAVSATTTPTATAFAPAPAKHAAPPRPAPTMESTPTPAFGKRVSVSLANHYSCSSTEKREGVMASPEPRGARITIIGQGPCPGDVHDWTAQVTETRVDVTASHGAANKCRCTGAGDLVLRGLDPGSYDVTVNGGYDRPIATHITVSQ